MTDLPPIEQGITLRSGDTLIASLPRDTTPEQLDRIRSDLVDELDDIHVVVVAGIDFISYRPRPSVQQVRDYLAEYGPHNDRWQGRDALSTVWDVMDALDRMAAPQ